MHEQLTELIRGELYSFHWRCVKLRIHKPKASFRIQVYNPKTHIKKVYLAKKIVVRLPNCCSESLSH